MGFLEGYQEKINYQKSYIRSSNGCKYWEIIFEQSYKWVPVWSIIGRSFKLLIFICLVSVNLWVFALAKGLAG